MPRYIDADRLGLKGFELFMCNGNYKEALKMVLSKIEYAPTIDAVEVVRCKDCKYYEEYKNGKYRCWTMILDPVKPTDFCSFAERREIENAPTVDAVPVVRCKDCKYAYMTYGGECKYCDMWEEEGEMYLDGDFYCAFGKRKEDGEVTNG